MRETQEKRGMEGVLQEKSLKTSIPSARNAIRRPDGKDAGKYKDKSPDVKEITL